MAECTKHQLTGPGNYMTSKSDFFAAAQRLIGTKQFERLAIFGYTPHDYCREIAQLHFIGTLQDTNTQADDLLIIQTIAKNLWAGDGTTGFVEK